MLKVLVTFDTDAVHQNNRLYEKNKLSFDFDRELSEVLLFFASEGIPSTAFVRIDPQVEEAFEATYVLEKVSNVIERSGRPKVELAWHPHIYSRSNGCYVVERDPSAIAIQLVEVHSRVTRVQQMSSVRVGAVQGGNAIMTALARLGFNADSSAFPGRKVTDAHRHFDWSRTTNHPYRPSMEDYQVSGAPHHPLLEIPITTLPLLTSYDKEPVCRALNPCFHTELFTQAISRNLSAIHDLGVIVLLFHPDELLSGYRDDLYCNGLENFFTSFRSFRSLLPEVRFLTVRDFTQEFCSTDSTLTTRPPAIQDRTQPTIG